MNKQTIRILLFSLFLLPCFASDAHSRVYGNSKSLIENTVSDDIIIHTVLQGETVFSIAKAYNTTIKEVYRLNPLAENGIKVGDRLRIAPLKPKPVSYKEHKIAAKETLSSVSHLYGISIDELVAANEKLSEQTFKNGAKIRIPIYTQPSDITNTPSKAIDKSSNMFLVAKGDTLYKIAKEYDVTVEDLLAANPALADGLKADMIIHIPYKKTASSILPKPSPTPSLPSTALLAKGDAIKIGILLPFVEDGETSQKEKIIEYYEGFLLGVKTYKEKGYDAEIYTFDIGAGTDNQKLKNLLETVEVKNLDLLIGGTSKEQIEILSQFSTKTGINYVIPFAEKGEGVNPHVFQITSTHASLYTAIAQVFSNKYKDYSIVFVAEQESDNNKADFVLSLQNVLSKSNIPYTSITETTDFASALKAKIDPSKKAILVPTSSSEVTLKYLLKAATALASTSIQLFGYPEWQTYTYLYGQLAKYNTNIYSTFFVNENAAEVKAFTSDFVLWYNKAFINSYPKFAFLGYDAASYFMTALHKQGNNLEANISSLKVPTLQSAVHFNNGTKNAGRVNTGFYFVQFNTDSSITKTAHHN